MRFSKQWQERLLRRYDNFFTLSEVPVCIPVFDPCSGKTSSLDGDPGRTNRIRSGVPAAAALLLMTPFTVMAGLVLVGPGKDP